MSVDSTHVNVDIKTSQSSIFNTRSLNPPAPWIAVVPLPNQLTMFATAVLEVLLY